MAASSNPYLPDLGKCFSGDVVLLSWSDILDALLSHDYPPSPAIRSFLSHSTPKKFLSSASPTFPRPSSQSKAAFESHASAVNTTSSSLKEYSIEEIKEDTNWLSKEVDIDELEALRLTILEWQSRPKARFKAGFSDAELASLRDGLGDEYVEALDLVPGGSFSRNDIGFDSRDAQRTRLLQTYFAEKASLNKVSYDFRQLSLQGAEEISANGFAIKHQWLTVVPQYQHTSQADAVHDACNTIQTLLGCLNGRSWQVEDRYLPTLNDDYATSNLQVIASTLQRLLLEVDRSPETTNSESILQWLRLMAPIEYFATFSTNLLPQQRIITSIQATASIITVALMKPQQALQALDTDTPENLAASDRKAFFLDNDHLAEMNELLLTAAGSANAFASPGILAWGLILVEIRGQATNARETRDTRQVQRTLDRNSFADSSGRRSSTSSTGSANQTIFEDVMAEILATSFVDDPVDSLLHAAVQGANVFSYLSQICAETRDEAPSTSIYKVKHVQELIRLARPIVGYDSDILDAQLAVLSTATNASISSLETYNPITNFMEDEFLMQNFFDAALGRFPYEALPFLRLCNALSHAHTFDDDGTQFITFRLRRLDSYTQAAIGAFEAYTTIREDENANLVSLENTVGMLDFDNHRLLTFRSESSSQAVIVAQTLGEVISDSFPPVVKWQHSYPGLALLGKWLELQSQSRLEAVLSPFESAEEVTMSIVKLVTQLLKSTFRNAKSTQTATETRNLSLNILSETAEHLDQDNTVLSLVSEILEQQVQVAGRRSASSNELLAACLDFHALLLTILPSDTWSIIARSSLFSSKGGTRSIASIISNSETQSNDYNILESFANLLNQCVDTVLNLSVLDQRQQRSLTKPLKANQYTVSQRLNSSIIHSFTNSMYAVFTTSQGWRFRDTQQKYRVTQVLTTAFSKTLEYVFGTGNGINSNNPLTTSLGSAAEFLVRTLADDGLETSSSNPVIRSLTNLFIDGERGETLQPAGKEALQSNLHLAHTVLRYYQTIDSTTPSSLPTQLLNALPILVRISQYFPTTAMATYQVMSELLSSRDLKQAPSLLGHLGSVTCISFLDCIKLSINSSRPIALQPVIWRLLSKLVTVDQQWLAIVLVTGSSPGREMKSLECSKLRTRGKPVLETTIDQLEKISDLFPEIATAMLQFLAEGQQNWPSVTDTILAHPNLFPALVRYVSERDVYINNDLNQAFHNQVAAAVTNLSVVHLHRLMALRDEKIFAIFIPLLTWLTENALNVTAYNSSLHSNLRKNFSMKYPGLDANMVKRTGLLEFAYGDSYFYDLELSDRIIGEDQYWRAPWSGFRAEFQRANVNLSIVDSELVLIKSFQYLCLEHGHFFARNRDVAKIMAQIVSTCLSANTQACPTETLFDNLFQTRADLAVMLVRPLVGVGAKGSDFVALLSKAWGAARFRSGSYEKAIMNEDLTYWQSVLSVLLMCLQFHAQKKPRSTALGQGVSIEEIDPSCALYCEIAAIIVGNGLQSIVSALQDQRAKHGRDLVGLGVVGTRDVMLVLNLLQGILRLPTLPQFEAQLSECLIASGVGQSALYLYSWSHLLMEDNQPVFADLSIRILASLSSLPKVAEELAVEGILNRISTARVTLSLQNVPDGVMHLDRRPNLALVYSVWCQGMLPVCLNLLHAIGAGVASEISSFLNQFPHQLGRASRAFSLTPPASGQHKHGITLDASSEASTLALIARILESFREAGPAAGVDPTDIPPLTEYDEHRKVLAEDVRDVISLDEAVRRQRTIPMNEKESAWQKMKDNLLDQKVLNELKQAVRCLNQNGDESG